jgi:autotransporter-associated beta strand protein
VQSFKRSSVDCLLIRYWLAGLSLNFILLGSSTVQGQDTWQGPTTNASWFTSSNWTLQTPNAQQDVLVNNGTTAIVDASEGAAASLTIGTTVPGSTVQFMPGGDVTVTNAITIGTGGTLRFSGGTLFTINASQILNNGTILFDGPPPEFLGGNVVGTGKLIMSMSGTLFVSGNQTYSGSTVLLSGTLEADSATALSPNSAFTVNSTLNLHGFNNTIGSLSGTGTVLNNGTTTATLSVGHDNTSTTFGGVLENGTSVLALTKIGSGTLTLTAANTYTGGTTISGGTLQFGNGGTTGSISGNVIDNGTLAFDRSNLVTFAGVISGTGNLTQLGSGTVTLTGANTYAGTTTVNAGSLIVAGSISGAQTVVNAGSLIVDGSISSARTVVNAGSLIVDGSISSAQTVVNGGNLTVDGLVSSAQTVVNPGGFVGGHGTIGGNLVNNGIVGQNNSPGTLTVNGNYTQNAGGTLRIGVGGLALGQHDLLAVNGSAAVGGTLQFMRLGNFNLKPGDQITFLTAKNGVSGTFSTVENSLVGTGTIVQVQITTLANSVVLEGAQGSFANTPGVAITPNEKSVAKALDSARGDPREAALFAFLNSQPLANLSHDLSLIAPTQISSINATAVSVGKVQASNIGQRLANIHAGSTGFSSAGFSINGGAASFGAGFAGVSGPEGKSGPAVFAPTPDNRWGVFVTGLGEFTNVDSTTNAAGYNVDTGGFTFGVDYRLTPNFALGLTAGYAHTTVNLDGGGNIDVNGGKIGLYATLFGNGFYLDAAVSGGPSGYNTHRTALQGTASGSTDGADVDALVAVGYDWKKGNLSIGPTASFQYSYVGLNSFTETGSLAPLAFPDQNTESERTAFGARASYEWKIGRITLLPQLSASWQHEFGSTAYSVVSSFATGAGKSFTVTGPDIGRDSLLVGAGATVILSERVSTYLYYDGEFARTNYLNNSVTGGVRITF